MRWFGPGRGPERLLGSAALRALRALGAFAALGAVAIRAVALGAFAALGAVAIRAVALRAFLRAVAIRAVVLGSLRATASAGRASTPAARGDALLELLHLETEMSHLV